MQVRFCPIGRTLDTSFSRKQLGRSMDVPFYIQATYGFPRAVLLEVSADEYFAHVSDEDAKS